MTFQYLFIFQIDSSYHKNLFLGRKPSFPLNTALTLHPLLLLQTILVPPFRSSLPLLPSFSSWAVTGQGQHSTYRNQGCACLAPALAVSLRDAGLCNPQRLCRASERPKKRESLKRNWNDYQRQLSTLLYFYRRKCVCTVAQSCLTLWDPLDCSPPGSSVHGILQARILEWVAISLLQVIFPAQGLNLRILCLLHGRPSGKPHRRK